MRYVKNIMIVLIIGLFVSGTAFAADVNGSLTVGTASGAPGDTVSLDVTLAMDDGAELGGVACTITYDSASLTYAGVEAVETQAFVEPTDGMTVDASTLYYQANGDTAGEVMIAAASASAVPAGVIFNVKFTVNEGVADKDYAIGIQKSVISNTSAGYSEAGDEIDALVGLPDGDTFTATLNGGKLTVSGIAKGDGSGDGIIDGTDALYILNFVAGVISEDQLVGDCDVNKDGVVDGTDALYILNYAAGVITSFD